MKQCSNRSSTTRALALAVLVGAAWSGAAQACSSEPYVSSMCIMSWNRTGGFANGIYQPAAGALLPLNNYQALFALIGTTYGGTGTSNFQLPDLRGRVLIGAGAGPGLQPYNVGDKGGAAAVTLTQLQMPQHVHPVATGVGGLTVTAGIGSLAATTTLAGLSATTSLSSVTASAAGSGLTLKGYSGGAGSASASGGALATPAQPANKIYAGSTPDVAMASGSIAGTATVSFSGNPTTTITGAPTTTLAGAPAVGISGTTGINGGSQPFSVLPPYLAMTYYIAVNGLFPSMD